MNDVTLADNKRTSFLTECPLSANFLRMFDNMKGVLFFVKNCQAQLVWGNLLLAEHCGFSSVEELCNTKSDFDIFPTEIAERYNLDDLEVMNSGQVKDNIVELFPNYLGDLAWFVTTKVPLFDSKGKVRGLCGILQSYDNSSNLGRHFGEISKAMDYIKEHYTEKISNATLADQTRLSVRQFENRFKDIFSTTPHKYILKLRILKACELLLTENMTIIEMATQLGFYDQSAFTMSFKKQVGLTPLKYIKKHTKR
ncbi:MAG: helix-turn-helix domain-containing protein [Lentisphaeraceae bacterium]|nr:helix-turn-helix domain-containing protein [Lentisphaeraceae bacterium]